MCGRGAGGPGERRGTMAALSRTLSMMPLSTDRGPVRRWKDAKHQCDAPSGPEPPGSAVRTVSHPGGAGVARVRAARRAATPVHGPGAGARIRSSLDHQLAVGRPPESGQAAGRPGPRPRLPRQAPGAGPELGTRCCRGPTPRCAGLGPETAVPGPDRRRRAGPPRNGGPLGAPLPVTAQGVAAAHAADRRRRPAVQPPPPRCAWRRAARRGAAAGSGGAPAGGGRGLSRPARGIALATGQPAGRAPVPGRRG